MASPFAGPSSPRKTPGVLDSSQRARLSTFTHSSLSFASFNPRTAISSSFARKISLNDELYNAKRIVIETTPNGESFWRFVPKAQREEGVTDEGHWPRVVDMCGTNYEISQEQWDMYKLDPLYECRVRTPPALTIITRVSPESPDSPPLIGKRSAAKAGIPILNPRKKLNTGDSSFGLESDDSEVEEVEDMVIDQSMPPPRARSAGLASKARKKREDILRHRQQRRENISRRAEKLSSKDYFDFSTEASSERSQSVPYESRGKRKATILAEPLRSPTEEESLFRDTFIYEQSAQGKRTRKASPGATKRELDAKRAKRDRRRQDRQRAKVNGRRQQWHEQFMQEVYAEVPDLRPSPDEAQTQDMQDNGYDDNDDTDDDESSGGPSPDTSFEEDAARAAAIAESRRKLAELESHRPLWEEAARKRALLEEAQAEAERLKIQERRWAEARRATEALRAETLQKIEEAKERQEAERQEREEAAKRQRERQQRQQRWSFGPWTMARALERYKVLSDAFDTSKFSANDPLSFDLVPWPVLTSPATLSEEDIDWNNVEKFFNAIQPTMRPQEFKVFVEKSHRRFHPDRWRARGLLRTIANEAERGCLEVAATTVSQALTPLWRDITGR